MTDVIALLKERRSSRGDPDQIGGLHPNIPSAADFQTHQTFPRVPAAGELQHWHCGPSIFSPQMETMRASAQELIIWVYCFAMFVVIFGSTVYYAERCSVPAQPSWQLTADSLCVQADGESPQPVHLHPQLHVVGGRHHVYRGYGEYRNEFYLPRAEVWI